MSSDNPTKVEKSEEKHYEPPKIIYDDVISTRAGSPILENDVNPPSEGNAIELFPSD